MSVDMITVSDTILVGESVRFQVRINPEPVYAKKHYWLLNSNRYLRLIIDTAFTQSGTYNATFHVIDYLDDTLSTAPVTITVVDKP